MAGSRPQFHDSGIGKGMVSVSVGEFATVSVGDGTAFKGKAFWIGGSGKLKYSDYDGRVNVLQNASGHLPYGCTTIWSASTTATDIHVVVHSSVAG